MPQSTRPRRPDLLLLLPPLVLAVLGSALLSRRRSLWYDELFTAQVAPLPLGRIADAVLSGHGTAPYLASVPPSYNAPYYVVVHGWLALLHQPPGELSLRSLSLVAAVLGVLLLVRAVHRLAGRTAAVAAGLAAATNPLLLEYSVEARGYGLAVLTTCATALALVRWLDGGSLWPCALGATAAGLAHWFALPVVAGLALAGLLLRRRAALPLVAVTALAALPALALVVLAARVDAGGTTTGWIADTGGAVPWLSLQAWTSKSPPLLAMTLLGVALAVRARTRLVAVGLCWVLVPVLLVTLAELARPVFVPRYLLPGLLGLAVLAGAGLAGRWRGAGVAALVAASLFASAPLATAPPRDDAKGAVAALAAQHVAGQPVVAVDRRAALALVQYARGSVRDDLLLPPDDAPPGEEVVWLLRPKSYTAPLARSDDDDQLEGRGFVVVQTQVFDGSSVAMVLQRWTLARR